MLVGAQSHILGACRSFKWDLMGYRVPSSLRSALHCRDFLLPRDFLLFFDGDAESAEDAFNYFDRNGDGSISCSELQDSAADMLCERKNIAASIKVHHMQTNLPAATKARQSPQGPANIPQLHTVHPAPA